ncbi:MAG TPA: hypothetical protein DF613_07550, partial [Lachnospiraceae bacterium]|nr:hypothetical protein [Lachnospiraceae bacterium]
MGRTDEKHKMKKEKRIKQGTTLCLLLAAAVFFYFAVIRNVFGGTVWDVGIYGLGCVIFAAVLGIWLWQLPLLDMLEKIKTEDVQRDAVQICCFACICLMTLYYYNSGSEYGHSVGTRVMNCAFGIALLCMCKREELQRRLTGYVQLCLAALFIAGTFLESRDSKETVLYVLSGITVWIYCRLLGSRGALIGWREIRRRITPYGWLVFAFFAGLVIFRNTRTWPFSVVIPFGWLYLYRFDTKKMNRLLKNYCYGCILAFWMMAGSGALFRPYYSFEFIRYPGWFSSVATAGLFWMLVIACTVSCILAKVRKGERISVRSIYFEWITLGAAGTYLFMTLSRTAALSVAVFWFLAFVLAELCYYRDSLKGMLAKIFLVVSPVLFVFPAVYTVTRCVPAIVGRPVWITGAEWFSDRIEKREPVDSTKFMNIAQLGETFLEKWVGLDINLTEIAGSVSGPGNAVTEENGETVYQDNVVGTTEIDGQVYSVKDYTFHNPDEGDVSNGRFELFEIYTSHLNMTGHDSMLVEDVDKNITLYHAHNSYIQTAYDHGIPTGILFILVVVAGVAVSGVYYRRNCREVNFAVYPFVVILSFMISGITEWIFHPSIPIGFAFLVALTPLVAAA